MGRTKVLYVHSSNELYGADIILLELVRRLDKTRFDPFVILPNDVPYEGLLSRELEKTGIRHAIIRMGVLRRKYFRPVGMLRYSLRLLGSTLRLIRIIKDERIDLVHSNTTAVLAGALACAVTKTPHLWHVHEIISHPAFLWRGTARMLRRFADQVVAVSTAVEEHLCSAAPGLRSKVRVIHNGIDLDRFSPASNGTMVAGEFGAEAGDVLVGMVARVSHWKGQELFLEATSEVAERCPRTKFALVGGTFPGQEYRVERLHDMVNALGLQDRVSISGFRRDIPQVWGAFDVAVSPSTQPDPFPTSVLEAMASGKPVVAAAHGGLTEMVADGVTGFLVPPADAHAIAEAVTRLALDKDMRKEMGAAGRERAENLFAMERFVRDFEDLYGRLW